MNFILNKVFNFLLKIYHFLIAFFSSVLYQKPSLKISVLGVTGTKGKTTVVELLCFLCKQAGLKTASFSSLREIVDKNETANLTGNTMPGRGILQRFLKKAVNERCSYAFIEVTSQGILQFRDKFIEWDGGFFLNIHPEHIEAHGSFENYRAAKVKFFKDVLKSKKSKKYFFINKDDKNHTPFYDEVKNKKDVEVIFFSKEMFLDGVKKDFGWDLSSPQKRREINSWLVPDFNLVNASAVYAFAKNRGIDKEVIKETFLRFKGVPGRFELVNNAPLVVVDYAHTPNSLDELYKAITFYYKKPESKIIGVLGSAGGGRDKWKRKAMGEIVANYCNKIILTNEDPFDEDPAEIIKEIKAGVDEFIKKNKRLIEVKEIIDRKEALREAIFSAQENDIVVATGKGSERYIRVASGEKIPWDEKGTIVDILKEKK